MQEHSASNGLVSQHCVFLGGECEPGTLALLALGAALIPSHLFSFPMPTAFSGQQNRGKKKPTKKNQNKTKQTKPTESLQNVLKCLFFFLLFLSFFFLAGQIYALPAPLTPYEFLVFAAHFLYEVSLFIIKTYF